MVSSEPRDIGTSKQLFLDEALVESSEGVRLTMHPPRKTNEILIAPDVGPGAMIGLYSTVRKEGNRVRIWYDDRQTYSVRYAESRDGIHFTRPDLRARHAEKNLPANAALTKLRLQGCCVWVDPHAPPEERYKTQAKCGPHPDAPSTLDFFSSPDGLRWTHMHSIEMGEIDTQNVVFWDESYGRYVMYTRRWVRFPDGNLNHRKVRRLESDDLIHWDAESVVWEADQEDLATFATSTGMPPVDCYGATVYKYDEAGDLHILLAEAFWHWRDRPLRERWGFNPDPKRRKSKVQRFAPSTMDVRLGYGRGGKVFHRAADRGPFIGLGVEGTFDSKIVWAIPDPIRMGDEIWIYYVGHNRDHDGFVDPAAPGLLSGISRAVMRLDGFVSADAGYGGGELTTRPFLFRGKHLELNVDAGGGGSIAVDVLDQVGAPVEGLNRQDARPFHVNAVDWIWPAGNSLESLAGRPIRLRFTMRDCKLYAFRFRD